MNAGARANHIKAQETGARIAQWRSEGLKYSDIGKLLGISPEAVKQRWWRFRKNGGE